MILVFWVTTLKTLGKLGRDLFVIISFNHENMSFSA